MSVTTIPQMEAVVDRLLDQKAGKRPYRTFFPLMRVKGHLLKMHRTKLSNYQRYIYKPDWRRAYLLQKHEQVSTRAQLYD